MKMRTFKDIEPELDLIPFVESRNGSLHVPRSAAGPSVLVRRFDRDLAPRCVPAYATLLASAQAWIDLDPSLSALVRVEQPLEIGDDFLSRPFVSATSLASFLDTDPDNDPPEAPEELAPMQERFRAQAALATGPRELLIATILARSVLEPSAKTMYSFREERFIVADLKPTRDELERLKQLDDECTQGKEDLP